MGVAYINWCSWILGIRGHTVFEYARYYVGVIGQNMFALIIAPPAGGHMSFLVCEPLALVCTTHMNKISVYRYGLDHST